MIRSISVVCIGNICRSPMAGGLLKEHLPEIHVRTAGLSALIGESAHPSSLRLMRDRGIDISAHRATQFVFESHRSDDLILVMDDEQKIVLEQRFNSLKGKTFLLGHFNVGEIFDPYKKGDAHFEECLDMIDLGVTEWVKRIKVLR